MSHEPTSNNQVLLAAWPHLPGLLMMAEHALVSRLHELLDEDITGDGSLPNMTWLDEEYPQLMEYLYKGGIGKPSLMPSQLCQLASDLFGMAADEFWVDEM